jgi:hypothetical protein
MAVLSALATEEPRPVHEVNPAVPGALAELVMQLLAKDPEKRPASADAVLDQLRQGRGWVADSTHNRAPVSPSSVTRQLGQGSRSTLLPKMRSLLGRRWLTLALGCVVAAVVVWAGWRLLPLSPTSRPDAGGTERFYLSEMDEIDPVNWPMKGPLPPGIPGADGRGVRVAVKGNPSPHGIFMHGPRPDEPRPGFASISYKLGGQFQTFHAEVSLNDGPRRSPPMTFRVHGDGKELWKSTPVTSQADTQPCSVSVAGVDLLTIVVRYEGEPMGTHAVWIEPYLAR